MHLRTEQVLLHFRWKDMLTYQEPGQGQQLLRLVTTQLSSTANWFPAKPSLLLSDTNHVLWSLGKWKPVIAGAQIPR